MAEGVGMAAVDVVEERVLLDRPALTDLRDRLARTRLPANLENDWQGGVPADWLSDLLSDWQSFDFDTVQDRLDELTHLRAIVGGQSVHLVRVDGSGADSPPLMLSHGWPGSFLEYLPVLPLLSDPAGHGADPGQAFTLIVPSLPGFGFSEASPFEASTHRSFAHLWHRLMTEGLGYQRYYAHGSDIGAFVTSWLALDHPDELAGIHLATPWLGAPADPRSPAEIAHAEANAAWLLKEGAYAHQQGTKPSTLAVGLMDSPAGLAAWIGEKFVSWSSTRPDGTPAFDRDLMLAMLTLYWVTSTISTSLLPYAATGRVAGTLSLPMDNPPPVPTAITVFGGERVPFPKPTRELAERYFSLSAWTEFEVGGHFPAVAEPGLLAQTLRRTLHPGTGPMH